jgi:hypothetical protein
MNAWQEYKKKLGSTRPWDLVTNAPRAEEGVAFERLAICEECPHLLNLTKQCKKCGCVMPLKVKLKEAQCPVGKW